MSEHLHTVRITGPAEHPTLKFTCHGGRDAECHSYPACECPNWGSDHEHPFVPHDECWMQSWFDNADNGGAEPMPEFFAECGIRPGMSGPIKTVFCQDYVEWSFIEGAEMHGIHRAEDGERCDICGKEAWRKHEGVLLCGAHWNAALERGEVADRG